MKINPPFFTKMISLSKLLVMVFSTFSLHATTLFAQSIPKPLNHFYQPLTRDLLNHRWVGLYQSMDELLVITSNGWEYYATSAEVKDSKPSLTGDSVSLIEPSSPSDHHKLALSAINEKDKTEVVFTFLVQKYIDASGKLHFLLKDESEEPFILTLEGDTRIQNIPGSR